MDTSEGHESSEYSLKGGWEELMGADLMLKKLQADFSSPWTSNLSPLDPDVCTEHAQSSAEIGDYVVLCFNGYFSREGEINIDDADHLGGSNGDNYDNSNMKIVKFVQEKDCIIKLGNGDVIPGLEMATRFLQKGESALVLCHSKYAYYSGRLNSVTTAERDHLPANTRVLFQIIIREIIPLGVSFNPNFRLKLGIQQKNRGNDVYKYEYFEQGNGKAKALKLYGDASEELMALIKDDNADNNVQNLNEIKSQCLKNIVDCFNNISSVHLRSKDYMKAKEAATEAIKIDPNNLKALCKAAKANLMMCNFEECALILDILEDLDAKNLDVRRLRRDFEHSKSLYRKNEKELYGKMLGSGPKTDKAKKLKESDTAICEHRVSTSEAKQTESDLIIENSMDIPKRSKWNIFTILLGTFCVILCFIIWKSVNQIGFHKI